MDSKISNRQEFIKFLEVFSEDLDKNPDSWENTRLDDFLGAMIRYTTDIQGYYDNMNQNVNADIPNWRVFADILQGARIYE